MTWNLIWIFFARMYLIMCCLVMLFVALVHSNVISSGLGYGVAISMPYSLIPFLVVSFLLSSLISLQCPLWLSSRLDLPLLACGAAVTLWILGAYIYGLHQMRQTYDRLSTRSSQTVDTVPVVKHWTATSWTGEMPDCLKLQDSTIENSCPGRVSLTYCWRMDPAKDWGLKEVDCELNQQTRRTFAVGSSELRVPWCRAYHETCQAELKAISAKAVDN